MSVNRTAWSGAPAFAPTFKGDELQLGDYGIKGDYLIGGSANQKFTDNSAAWNDIVPLLYPGITAYLPAGHACFNSPISQLPDGVRLVGAGSTSAMVRNFSSDAIFLLLGAVYPMVERVSFFTADGTVGGIALGHIATDWMNCCYRAILRDLVVTCFGSGRWAGGIRLDGMAGYPHYGTRAHVIDGVLLGNAINDYGIMLAGCNGANLSNIIMAPGGTWGLWVMGSDDQPSASNVASGVLNCAVLMDNSHNLTVYGGAFGRVISGYKAASNTLFCNSLSQVPELYGPNNHVHAGKAVYSSEL